MKTLIQKLLIWSVWLVIFATAWIPCATASTFPTSVTFGYDGRNQTTVASESTSESAVGYDAAPAFSMREKLNETARGCVPFVNFAEFLAAKTGGNVGKMADDVLEWLGADSTLSKPPGGSDLVLRSADGTKQIRFDLANPHGLGPHVNVETFEPRNLFPGDRKMIQTGNDHVFPKP